MDQNDNRHGTARGYSAHHRAGQVPCKDCRDARARERTDTRKNNGPSRAKPITSASNYVDTGYDPDDGLDETRGRWMWDDERFVRVWVVTGDVA